MGPVGRCGVRGRGGAAGTSSDGSPLGAVAGAASGNAPVIAPATSAGIPPVISAAKGLTGGGVLDSRVAESSPGVSSLGGSCFHLWPHFAQRTLRPASPSNAASNENRVVQAGQETITDSSARSITRDLYRSGNGIGQAQGAGLAPCTLAHGPGKTLFLHRFQPESRTGHLLYEGKGAMPC